MAFTFFFRDMNVLETIQTDVLPVLLSRRCLNIWDAGCATGVEPFSLAIILREKLGDFTYRNVKILATDLNPTFESLIKEATYPQELVGRIPDDILGKYFVPDENKAFYRLCEQVRRTVTFKHHDLASLNPVGEKFGLIVCKNVLLHIQPETRTKVIKMFYDSLVPGGYLATEQTQKMPNEAADWFEPIIGKGIVYRKTDSNGGNTAMN
jgi:chemotaxis protein methyltransferase CheR